MLDNRIHLRGRGSRGCCNGIALQSGTEPVSATYPNVRPRRYPDGNLLRDVDVRGNQLDRAGDLAPAVCNNAGSGGAGGSRNKVRDVHISRNVLRARRKGIWVVTGGAEARRYATRNRITRLRMTANRIRVKRLGRPDFDAGGIVLMGGGNKSRGGLIRGVRLAKNTIKAAGPGISLIGGVGHTARHNRVMCVRLTGNRVSATRGVVSVRSNEGGATNLASLGLC